MLIVFASIHQVNAVKRRLLRLGTVADMVRTPQCLAHTGCSFALRCTPEQVPALLQVAAAAGITSGDVFEEPALPNIRFLASPSGGDEEP